MKSPPCSSSPYSFRRASYFANGSPAVPHGFCRLLSAINTSKCYLYTQSTVVICHQQFYTGYRSEKNLAVCRSQPVGENNSSDDDPGKVCIHPAHRRMLAQKYIHFTISLWMFCDVARLPPVHHQTRYGGRPQ